MSHNEFENFGESMSSDMSSEEFFIDSSSEEESSLRKALKEHLANEDLNDYNQKNLNDKISSIDRNIEQSATSYHDRF